MCDKAKKVLLVDDDADFLEQLRMRFEAMGYEVLAPGGQSEA